MLLSKSFVFETNAFSVQFTKSFSFLTQSSDFFVANDKLPVHELNDLSSLVVAVPRAWTPGKKTLQMICCFRCKASARCRCLQSSSSRHCRLDNSSAWHVTLSSCSRSATTSGPISAPSVANARCRSFSCARDARALTSLSALIRADNSATRSAEARAASLCQPSGDLTGSSKVSKFLQENTDPIGSSQAKPCKLRVTSSFNFL